MFGEQYPFSDYLEYLKPHRFIFYLNINFCRLIIDIHLFRYLIFCRRYDLFPVQHELRRRRNDYINALNEISRMPEAYISSDSGCCDGIDYSELVANFSWEADYKMSSYTKNFAAIIIQRGLRSKKAYDSKMISDSSLVKAIGIIPSNASRPFKTTRQTKGFRVKKN